METRKIRTMCNHAFTIKLEENPSTGYGWVLSHLPQNIYLLSDTYTPAPHMEGLFGSGGQRTFVFRAMEESNNSEIQFKYMRPWENTSIKDLTYEVSIDNAIRYERITDYFVNNSFEPGRHHLVIDNKKRFDEVFSPAAVMFKEQRWITEADFKNNIVVAIVMPEEKRFYEFKVEAVQEKGNQLDVMYALNQHQITWTARCCMILLVEKANYNQVVFFEANQQEAQVQVKEACAQV